MNNPFDYTPTTACREAFARLLEHINTLNMSEKPEVLDFCKELESGKMLGVLIAVDSCGGYRTLYAFSGQAGNAGFHFPGFVEPVFDYLSPTGYFKRQEARISALNYEIECFQNNEYIQAQESYTLLEDRCMQVINAYKSECRVSKAARAERRATGTVGHEESDAMIRQSQFEKAELRRLKQRMQQTLGPCATLLEQARSRLETMKEQRRRQSEELQSWLFANFKVVNARGESKSLSEIFAAKPMGTPPSGAGECCAPKLLQGAYIRGWKPLEIAEYWYGQPKGGEVRVHGHYYPACRGKCLPVLEWMLQGLEVEPPLECNTECKAVGEPVVVFENQWFCVVDKPSGMLSVPGKGIDRSVQQWLTQKYGEKHCVKMIHRLDRDTSGLLIAAFEEDVYKQMQALFARRMVKKEYVAELEGDYKMLNKPHQGCIRLPLSPDWLDRPRQRVDMLSGKEAVTDYEFIGTHHGRSRIIFHPHTGRTHQLRIHAASEMGLAMPIAGDKLYGISSLKTPSERMLLHARKIEFVSPLDGKTYIFESEVPF